MLDPSIFLFRDIVSQTIAILVHNPSSNNEVLQTPFLHNLDHQTSTKYYWIKLINRKEQLIKLIIIYYHTQVRQALTSY